MNLHRTITVGALCVALAGGPAVATESQSATTRPAKKQTVIAKDIALQGGGLLKGYSLNTQMKPVAGATVLVQYQGHVIARTKSAKDGSFAVQGLRNGLHTVSVGSKQNTVRFWTAKAAPPKASRVLAVNGEERIMRGQYIPPVSLPIVITAIGSGVIGGIIGYQLRDDDGGGGGGTPASP